MPVTSPSSYHIDYYKYQTGLAQQNFVISDLGLDFEITYSITQVPSWLESVGLLYDASEDEIRFTLKVNENLVNTETFPATDYSATIRVNYNSFYTGPQYILIPVTMTVYETVFLTLNPTTLSFNYTIGNPLPQNQTIGLTTESSDNWVVSANQSWVNLLTENGQGNGIISLGVDPSGLTVGQYQAIITVNGNAATEYATVILNVNEGDTETDFLYINPSNMQFISELGVPNLTTKNLTVEASHAWTAVSSDSWLVVSSSGDDAGNYNLTVSVDSDDLTDTTISYLGQITLSCQGIQKIVYVELILVEFLMDGLMSEGLYFSDDRNKLTVTNVYSNMYLQLHAVASTGQENVPYILEAPYSNGYANALIGMETNFMLKSVGALTSLFSGVRNRIRPITINLKAYNKNKFSGATSLINTFFGLKFLTGKTPEIENKLCYVPETIFMSKKGIVSLTALAQSALSTVTTTAYAEALNEVGGEFDVDVVNFAGDVVAGPVDVDNDEEAHAGTVSIKFPSGSSLFSARLTRSTFLPLQNGVIKFWLKTPTAGTINFYIRFKDSQNNQTYTARHVVGGSYGVDENSTEWQEIVVPIAHVGTLTEIKFQNYATSTVLHIDDVQVLSTPMSYTLEDSNIYITGDITQTLATSIDPSNYVYNALVNLASLNLSVGNQINIAFADLDVNVVITEDAIASTMIAFENEWREYEFFECRGALTKSPTAEPTKTVLQVEGTKHTKTVSIDSGADYILNTGWIYTQEEADWLARLLDSKRVFIYIDGSPVEVDMQTKKLDIFKTRENMRSYNLKFKKAIV